MKEKKRTSRSVHVAVLILVLALPAQALIGAIPVIDASNLSQNILQVAQAIAQVRNLIAQLDTMYRNLERVADPNWRDLTEHVEYLNELTQQGRALSYANEDVFAVFSEVLPGFVAMEPGHFNEAYGGWTEIALDTLAATLDSAGAQAFEYGATQEQLAELRAIADEAGGNLEALNASNMLAGHTAQEVAKLNQLLAAGMNAQNVYFGYRLNLDANQEATARALVEDAGEEFHFYTGLGGFTGIPADWPFPCFGCARDRR